MKDESVFCAAFEPGILKREGNSNRVSRELSTTIRSAMGDNQVAVVAFAQNTRDEVRIVNGDGTVVGALAAEPGMKQTNYLMKIDNKLTTTSGIECLCPHQPQTHRVYDPGGVFPSVMANTGKAGQDQAAILNSNNTTKGKNKMKAEVRRLTTTEVQRLQGFDEGHLDVNNQGDSSKYAEAGNSWAVPNARFVIKGIHKVDEKLTGKRRGFKYGTISSGVEAHTQASAGLGDKAVFLSEISPAPCGVLAAHYPEVPNLGDMTLVDFDPEKKCIHNRPYDGYQAPDEKDMGFKPYKTPEPVEIPCEFGEVDLVSGGTPCFTAGNMVLTESGYRPIEEIKIGDKVITHEGRLRKVIAIGKKMADNIVAVDCASRNERIVCTSDHKFWSAVNPHQDFRRRSDTYLKMLFDGCEFKEISKIGVGGYVAELAQYEEIAIPTIPKVYDASYEDIIELAGWYVGDGYVRRFKKYEKECVILTLSQKKKDKFCERFSDKINFSTGNPDAHGVYHVQIACTSFSKWVVANFGHLAQWKNIPAWLICANNTIKSSFLVGYMETDGYNNNHIKFGASTVSRGLAYGLADLVGKSCVCKSNVNQTKKMPDGRVVNQRNFFTVRRHKSPNRFHDYGKWSFVRVKGIESKPSAEVYNITVEEDHSYIINGIAVKNCQDLSVAGKRKGAVEGSNTRSSLAFQLPRIGAAVGAKYIVWENVAGAFSSNGGRDFAWLIHRMTQYGYKALAWRCMDAQFIRTDKHPRGVPQRRRRVWIVGYRGDDWRVPCESLFEPMKVLGNEPPKRTVGIGFLKKVNQPSEGACPKRSELEEFDAFIAGAKPRIIELLEKKGVCESVVSRRKELEAAERRSEAADVDDLFGCCGGEGDLFGTATEEKHQGRGLKAKDLELNFPGNGEIRSVQQVEIYKWAKTVCNEIGYFGELFKSHEGEATVDDLSPKMLENIGNAGFLCDGLVCTMKMPEWNAGVTEEELATMPRELAELYDGDVCGLSDILEPNPDPKYGLSWRACYGILRRAVNRGKKLPIELGYSLVDRIIEQAAFVKWIAENGSDKVKKEGDISVRQVAKIAFDDFIEAECHWVDVVAVDPKTEEADEEPESDGCTSDEDCDTEEAE